MIKHGKRAHMIRRYPFFVLLEILMLIRIGISVCSCCGICCVTWIKPIILRGGCLLSRLFGLMYGAVLGLAAMVGFMESVQA